MYTFLPRIRIRVLHFQFVLAGNYSTDLILQDEEVGGNVRVNGVRLVIAQLRRDVTILIYCFNIEFVSLHVYSIISGKPTLTNTKLEKLTS